jgi:hypothetical protein
MGPMPVNKGYRRGGAFNMLKRSDRFQMARVAAGSVKTQVMQVQARRNRAVRQLKADPWHDAAFAVDQDSPIPSLICVKLPIPAAGALIDQDVSFNSLQRINTFSDSRTLAGAEPDP